MNLKANCGSIILASFISLIPLAAQAQPSLKVFISADMEGVAGVVTAD
jgi:hypothetical protein